MGTQRVLMKGGPSWLVRWALRAGTRDFCPALAALVGPVQNICFSTLYTISINLSPSPSKLDRQSCRIGCLFICVSGVNMPRPARNPGTCKYIGSNIFAVTEHTRNQIFLVRYQKHFCPKFSLGPIRWVLRQFFKILIIYSQN
jgi:hypothetical protein